MSILTEGEIDHCADAADAQMGCGNGIYTYRDYRSHDSWYARFASAVQDAVLAKLAGMELPSAVAYRKPGNGDYWDYSDHGFGWGLAAPIQHALFTAAQLHQAFAQGAASQLSAEPIGFISPHDLNMLQDGYPATVVMLSSAKRTQPLYTLKEPK